jgi:hypothetical protein
LLLVRLRAPLILPGGLSLGMAICVGWNWSTVIPWAQERHSQTLPLAQQLHRGAGPLSTLGAQHCRAVGWDPVWGTNIAIGWFDDWRNAGVALYQRRNRGPYRSLGWKAVAGQLGPGIEVVNDGHAVGGKAIQTVAPTVGGRAAAAYLVEVPSSASYQISCRAWSPSPGQVLLLRVDDGAPQAVPVPTGSDWSASSPDTPLHLDAGRHKFTVALPATGVEMDLMELTPQ